MLVALHDVEVDHLGALRVLLEELVDEVLVEVATGLVGEDHAALERAAQSQVLEVRVRVGVVGSAADVVDVEPHEVAEAVRVEGAGDAGLEHLLL